MHPSPSSLLGAVLWTLLFFTLANVGFPLLASSLPPGMGETLYLQWGQRVVGASTARGALLWVSLGPQRTPGWLGRQRRWRGWGGSSPAARSTFPGHLCTRACALLPVLTSAVAFSRTYTCSRSHPASTLAPACTWPVFRGASVGPGRGRASTQWAPRRRDRVVFGSRPGPKYPQLPVLHPCCPRM